MIGNEPPNFDTWLAQSRAQPRGEQREHRVPRGHDQAGTGENSRARLRRASQPAPVHQSQSAPHENACGSSIWETSAPTSAVRSVSSLSRARANSLNEGVVVASGDGEAESGTGASAASGRPAAAAVVRICSTRACRRSAGRSRRGTTDPGDAIDPNEHVLRRDRDILDARPGVFGARALLLQRTPSVWNAMELRPRIVPSEFGIDELAGGAE